jgi:hypothetical protein
MYNLKIDNQVYTIPALGRVRRISIHEVVPNLIRLNLPVRDLSSDIQDLMDYLVCPPSRSLKGNGSRRVSIDFKWALSHIDEDHKKRMKVYEYLESNEHSIAYNFRFVSYEAAIVLRHHGKILCEFLNL